MTSPDMLQIEGEAAFGEGRVPLPERRSPKRKRPHRVKWHVKGKEGYSGRERAAERAQEAPVASQDTVS